MRSWTCSWVVVVVVACCGGQWVERPVDVSAALGLSATFNCSAGDSDIIWLKLDDATGSPTLLFANTRSWIGNSTRISALAMPGGGISLVLTSLERSDDARYQCTAQDSLSHIVTLTVLGICLSLSHRRPVFLYGLSLLEPSLRFTSAYILMNLRRHSSL